ncbi:MAG TPA: hypothetical protein VH724_15400 [Candidatus Angelobacter sp.]|nr:hypothetical protein [Candidatus Angelobacter sp.]
MPIIPSMALQTPPKVGGLAPSLLSAGPRPMRTIQPVPNPMRTAQVQTPGQAAQAQGLPHYSLAPEPGIGMNNRNRLR